MNRLTQCVSQLSVYHQISIASDGRGEVGIEGNIESIMTGIDSSWDLGAEVARQLLKSIKLCNNHHAHKNKIKKTRN